LSVKINHKTLIITTDGQEATEEYLALETPYQIALNDDVFGTSMVLPTSLEEFGVGYLFALGYIKPETLVKEVYVCPKGRISVYADVDTDEEKELIVTSGCGGTGKVSREMLESAFAPLNEIEISLSEIRDFIIEVLRLNTLNMETHCVHACGYWSDGKLQAYYEDVGRHNAVDKVIGGALLRKYRSNGAIYTTGRLTSDMVLKCARVGIPVVMSRTAPSSLGLEIAQKSGVTLVGYARPDKINVFNAQHRIKIT